MPRPRRRTQREIEAHRSETWTEEALRALGRESDQAIGDRIGLTREAVRQKRGVLGIPAAGLPSGPRPRAGATASVRRTLRLTPDEDAAFARAADEAGIEGGEARGVLWLRRLGRERLGLGE